MPKRPLEAYLLVMDKGRDKPNEFQRIVCNRSWKNILSLTPFQTAKSADGRTYGWMDISNFRVAYHLQNKNVFIFVKKSDERRKKAEKKNKLCEGLEEFSYKWSFITFWIMLVTWRKIMAQHVAHPLVVEEVIGSNLGPKPRH